MRAASSALPTGAKVVPRGVAAFVALSTRFHSRQWKRDLALVRAFPAGRRVLARAFRRVDFAREVKPALGPEVDLVWLDFRANDLVGLTKPPSETKLKALLNKGGGAPTYTRRFHGWIAFADSKRLLDRLDRDRGSPLADDGPFKDAMGRLDEHAAVRLYLRGKGVQRELDRGLVASGAPPQLSEEVGTLVSVAIDGSAEPAGARVDGLVTVENAMRPNAYTAKLPEVLPRGALFYASFNHLDLALKKTLKLVTEQKPGFEQQLSQVESIADVTLSHDIFPLLSHEGAVAVYAASPVPTILFALTLKDAARARRVLTRIVSIAELGGGRTLRANSFVVDGVEVDELDFRSGERTTRVFAAVFADKLVVVNDERTLRTVIGGSGPKLADDPAFTRIQRLAGMPQRTLGFTYANLHSAIPLVFDLDRASGAVVTPADAANSKPFRSALVYATRDGDRYALTGFAAIK